jgi:hypothetical protein
MKFYVFGDSFFEHNANWIEKIATDNKVDEIKNYALSGVSSTYILKELIKVRWEINPEDMVLIGLTSFSRSYFGDGIHADTWFADNPYRHKSYRHRGLHRLEEKAVVDYYKYLFDLDTCALLSLGLKHLLKHEIFPNLNTKRKAIVNSFHQSMYVKPEYFEDPEFDKITLFDAAQAFLIKNNIIKSKEDTEGIQKAISGPGSENHWIDHPDYEEYFWKHFKPLLKNLYEGV